MVYKKLEDLPEELRVLPRMAQKLFMSTANDSITRVDQPTANKVAWKVVKSKFERVEDKWVARGMGRPMYTFKLKNKTDTFVSRGMNGEFYLEAVLSDNQKDSHGTRFTDKALKDYAKQINKFGINGFITHDDWDEFKMANSHLSEEEFVSRARTERKGILKTIKAVYQKGKLWIKALIDKRYVNQVKKFTEVSIEALVPEVFRTGDEFTGGHVLGLALLNKASNSRAKGEVKYEESKSISGSTNI